MTKSYIYHAPKNIVLNKMKQLLDDPSVPIFSPIDIAVQASTELGCSHYLDDETHWIWDYAAELFESKDKE